jgi:hypothetical protein
MAGEDAGPGLAAALQDLGKTWASTAALVTVVLYALGFVALRFHFQVLGVETERQVIDTGYLAAGGRVVLWLMLLGVLVAPPMLLLTWLARLSLGAALAASRVRSALEAVTTLVLLGLILVVFAALTPTDVLRSPTVAPGGRAAPVLAQLTREILAEPEPGRSSGVVAGALVAAAIEFVAIMLAVVRWRRSPRLDPMLGIIVLTAVAGLVALVSLHGVFFIPKRVEQLTASPTVMAARVARIWLVHRGADKATLYYCTADGEPTLATVPIGAIDGIGASPARPIGDIMGAKACAQDGRPL